MDMFPDRQTLGLSILRLGLAAVYLWFGFSQLFDSVNWVGWVPTWAVELLNIPPAMIVILNGSLEVVLGSLLAVGLFIRPVAFILTVHLALITYEIGVSAIGVRDFGLTMATLALAFLSNKSQLSLPSFKNLSKESGSSIDDPRPV